MLALSSSRRYFLYGNISDMRKGFDSLSGTVRDELKQDPLSGDIFIFFNRRRNQIKLLLFEGDGFSMYYKRLEKGTYEIPISENSSSSIQIKSDELSLILQGISLISVRRRPRYKNTL
jgi:transposase